MYRSRRERYLWRYDPMKNPDNHAIVRGRWIMVIGKKRYVGILFILIGVFGGVMSAFSFPLLLLNRLYSEFTSPILIESEPYYIFFFVFCLSFTFLFLYFGVYMAANKIITMTWIWHLEVDLTSLQKMYIVMPKPKEKDMQMPENKERRSFKRRFYLLLILGLTVFSFGFPTAIMCYHDSEILSLIIGYLSLCVSVALCWGGFLVLREAKRRGLKIVDEFDDEINRVISVEPRREENRMMNRRMFLRKHGKLPLETSSQEPYVNSKDNPQSSELSDELKQSSLLEPKGKEEPVREWGHYVWISVLGVAILIGSSAMAIWHIGKLHDGLHFPIEAEVETAGWNKVDLKWEGEDLQADEEGNISRVAVNTGQTVTVSPFFALIHPRKVTIYYNAIYSTVHFWGDYWLLPFLLGFGLVVYGSFGKRIRPKNKKGANF